MTRRRMKLTTDTLLTWCDICEKETQGEQQVIECGDGSSPQIICLPCARRLGALAAQPKEN